MEAEIRRLKDEVKRWKSLFLAQEDKYYQMVCLASARLREMEKLKEEIKN